MSVTPTRGFTLIETLVTLSIAGVLSSIAYPSIEGQLQRGRRADAQASMMRIQLAQERWRSNESQYAELAQIGIGATSAGGHYTLRAEAIGSNGYTVFATATGAQQRDSACRVLRLTVAGADLAHASGPDASTANTSSANRRCWNL